jgi:hypothetical protein
MLHASRAAGIVVDGVASKMTARIREQREVL